MTNVYITSFMADLPECYARDLLTDLVQGTSEDPDLACDSLFRTLVLDVGTGLHEATALYRQCVAEFAE